MTDLEKGYDADEARAAGRQGAAKRARDRRPQRRGHEGADEGHQDAQRRWSRSPRPQYSIKGPAQRVDESAASACSCCGAPTATAAPTSAGRVVAHELVHAALASRTSARTPPWLIEGIAMYVSGDNRAGDAGALISGRGVLKDASKQARRRSAMSLTRLSKPRRWSTCRRSPQLRVLVLLGGRVRDRREVRPQGAAAALRAFNSEKLNEPAGRASSPTRRARTLEDRRCSTLERDLGAGSSRAPSSTRVLSAC